MSAKPSSSRLFPSDQESPGELSPKSSNEILLVSLLAPKTWPKISPKLISVCSFVAFSDFNIVDAALRRDLVELWWELADRVSLYPSRASKSIVVEFAKTLLADASVPHNTIKQKIKPAVIFIALSSFRSTWCSNVKTTTDPIRALPTQFIPNPNKFLHKNCRQNELAMTNTRGQLVSWSW